MAQQAIHADFPETGARAKLVMQGDGQVIVPYSLAFDAKLSALDVRVWMVMRVMGERRKTIYHDQLCTVLNVSQDEVIESIGILDSLGWIVVTSKQPPTVSTKRLSLPEILVHNPDFMDNLKQYVRDGSSRLKQVALECLSDIQQS